MADTRRTVAAAICGACWVGAGTTIVFEFPKHSEVRGFLLAVAIALIIWIRTASGPHIKKIAGIFYAKGLNDALQRVEDDDGPSGSHRHLGRVS